VTVTLAAGKRTTSDTITTDTKEYTKKFGQWFETPKTSSGSDFGKILAATGGFVDAGMDTRDGKSLHHLTLADASKITGTDIGLPIGVAASAKVTVEGWADDTGTPIAMRVNASWDQPTSGGATTPAQMVIDMAFNGTAATAAEPTGSDLWVMKKSKFFTYTMGVPSDWTYVKGTKKYFDAWNGFDTGAQVGGYAAKGWTTNTWTAYAIKHPTSWMSDIKKAHSSSSTATHVAGTAARTFLMWGTVKSTVWYHQVAITSHGGKIWTIVYATPRKPTAEDKAMFASFLASFSFK
jgi:hypothetical protein